MGETETGGGRRRWILGPLASFAVPAVLIVLCMAACIAAMAVLYLR